MSQDFSIPMRGLPPAACEAVTRTSTKAYATKADWHRNGPHIKRLYVEENKKLKDVMTIMQRDYGHRGTVKMYKSWIGKWNLDKKTKEEEAWAVLRLCQQRKSRGKDSVFRVRDKSVTIDDVLRYFKRKGILNPEAEVEKHRGRTPPAIVCTTPPSSPKPAWESGSELNCPGTPGFVVDGMDADEIMRYLSHEETQAIIASCPDISSYDMSEPLSPLKVFHQTEQLMFCVRDWYRGAFENELFETDSEGYLVPRDRTRRDNPHIKFKRLCRSGIQLMNSRLFDEGGRSFDKATSLLASIIRSQHPCALQFLFLTILEVGEKGYPEISKMLWCSIRDWAAVTLTRDNQWIHIFSQICHLDDFHLKFTINQTMMCVSDTLNKLLGQFHVTALIFAINSHGSRASGNASCYIPALFAKGTQNLDASDLRLLNITFRYAQNLFLQNQKIKAIELLDDVVAKLSFLGLKSMPRGHLLALLARYQYSVGQNSKAECNLRKAIQICAGRPDTASKVRLLEWKTILASWLRIWRRGREAAVLDTEMEEDLGPNETGPSHVRMIHCSQCRGRTACENCYYAHIRLRNLAVR